MESRGRTRYVSKYAVPPCQQPKQQEIQQWQQQQQQWRQQQQQEMQQQQQQQQEQQEQQEMQQWKQQQRWQQQQEQQRQQQWQQRRQQQQQQNEVNTSAVSKVAMSVQELAGNKLSIEEDDDVIRNGRMQTNVTSMSIPKYTVSQVEEDFVGFSSLPEQVHRKAVRRGFDFTLMVVGESGLGKSTLISSLFLNTEMYSDRTIPPVQERITKTVQIEKKNMEIEEKGIRLRLTIVDTPGFNEALKGDESWRQIEGFVDQQFDHYFRDESGVNRKHINDTRVHCCLYFISPFGHGLRPIDIRFMKQLHTKVNIVPIIAKADTVTKAELHKLKSKLLDQIEENHIHIYEFPECASDEDEEFKVQDKELKASFPFAVVGSNTVVEVNGQKVRGRLYPWGIVEVDNPEHCDFIKLRQMLISTHMQDLKDVTRDVHYENYRAKYITEHIMKNQRDRNKLKRDSSPNFDNVVYADTLLQVKEDEIRHMQEMLDKMQSELNKNRTQGNGYQARPE